MGRFDQNTDQKVSAQEMLSLSDPKGRFELIGKMMDNLVSKVDTNKDTFIDRTEWVTDLSGLDKNVDGLLFRSDLHHGRRPDCSCWRNSTSRDSTGRLIPDQIDSGYRTLDSR